MASLVSVAKKRALKSVPPPRGFKRTIKCIAYPNRNKRRVFTPRSAGNIVCRIIGQAGQRGAGDATLADIKVQLRRELDRCFPCGEGKTETENVLQQAVAAARQALSDNATVIAIALSVLLALVALPQLLRFFPAAVLSLLPLVARQAITQIPGIIARLQMQQAANQAMFRRVSGL